ncbi:MAG: hypothetical protein WAT72_03280 [Microgenomates group bacterium]|jgi:hypothetical protein|nr:hypothetical protein [Candidatus Woesebacteria bacterium]MBP6882778.1 hypothetical protein [Candidatus Woesebacteria bacterium]QQR63647.1 MAG: hypothetical protein IPH70_04025 [Candidatus Roizmanbacteria bacterium]
MAKRKANTVARRSVHPLESPIVQIGIVFIVLCALFLMFYAGKTVQMYQ